MVVCGVPAVAAIDAAAPGELARAKAAGVPTPAAPAETAKLPVTLLAVAVTLAEPVAPVVTTVEESAAEAPDAGGVNVTCTPGTALLSASRTVTVSGVEKAPPTAADCGVPPTP